MLQFLEFHQAPRMWPARPVLHRALLLASLVGSIVLGLCSSLPAAAAAGSVPLTLSMAESPDPALAGFAPGTPYGFPGQTMTYTLGVGNWPPKYVCVAQRWGKVCNIYTGNTDKSGVVLQDTLPAGALFQSASGDSGFSCGLAGQLVTCSNGSIAAGGTGHVTIKVSAPAAGPGWPVSRSGYAMSENITNSATVTGGAVASVQTQVSLDCPPAC